MELVILGALCLQMCYANELLIKVRLLLSISTFFVSLPKRSKYRETTCVYLVYVYVYQPKTMFTKDVYYPHF